MTGAVRGLFRSILVEPNKGVRPALWIGRRKGTIGGTLPVVLLNHAPVAPEPENLEN
jgi:hypothetical protein